MIRIFLLALVLTTGTACLTDGFEPRPLRDFRVYRLQEGERREVTGWLQLEEDLAGTVHAYLREETHTFEDGSSGVAYAVFNKKYQMSGQISATGQVARFRKHRRTQEWRLVDLGRHELIDGVALLVDLDRELLSKVVLKPMKLEDVVDAD